MKDNDAEIKRLTNERDAALAEVRRLEGVLTIRSEVFEIRMSFQDKHVGVSVSPQVMSSARDHRALIRSTCEDMFHRLMVRVESGQLDRPFFAREARP